MPVFGGYTLARTATKARPARTTMQLALVHVAGDLMTNLLRETDRPGRSDPNVWFAREEVAGVRQGFGRFRARCLTRSRLTAETDGTSDLG